MSLRMTYVGKRSDSERFQFRMRVPTAVLERVRGRRTFLAFPNSRRDHPDVVSVTIGPVVKFSLRTDDASVAKERDAIARAELRA